MGIALGLTLGAALSLMSAGPAVAGTPGPTENLGTSHGLEYMRAKFANVVSQAGAPANCDGDAESTGGGGSVKGSGDQAHLNSSYPTSPTEGWLTEGRTSTPAGTTVTTFAICAGLDVKRITATNSLGSGESFNDGGPCVDLDGSLLSGGIRGTGGDAVINGTFPSDDLSSWIDSTQNLGAADSSVTAYWSCASGLEPKYRKADSKVAPGDDGKAIASCKPGEAVAGGGLLMVKSGDWQHDVWALAMNPKDSKDDADKVPDDRWLARAHNDTGAKVTLEATAVCLK